MPKAGSGNVDRRTLSSPVTTGPSSQQKVTHQYRLLERLSVGDHAEVFKANVLGIEGFERTVALKRILPSLAQDQELVRTFIEEAKTAAQMHHENIAKVLDLGRLEDSYFVALEFIDGRDLRTIFDTLRARAQVMPVPWACYVIMQLCECLDYVHSQRDEAGRQLSLVRRALCPQDVMVGFEGEVKLIDVGVARTSARTSATHPGIRKPASGYLSPEQVHGSPVDHRSDIFILGILLFEMLAGEKLFAGKDDFSSLEKIRDGRVVLPTSLDPRMPAALEGILLKALAKDVGDRYQDVRDFRLAIEEFLLALGRLPSRKGLADWMKHTFANQANQSEGLDWDEEELETEVFEHRPALRLPPSNTNSFLADKDAETMVTEPDPDLLAETGEASPTPHSRTPPDRPVPRIDDAVAVAKVVRTSRRTGRPADLMSLPVPSFAASSPDGETAAQAPQGAPPPRSGPPAAGSWTPLPGTPILSPVRRGAPPTAPNLASAFDRVRNLQPRYFLLFVLFLLVGGVGTYLLVPRSGMVQISVKPVDAHLALDGRPVRPGPPFRLEKREGIYRLTVSRPGYIAFDRNISIRAGQRGEMDVVLQPSPDTGFALTSTPPNLLVWLDGQPLFLDQDGEQATTNLRATRIAPGPHVLELKGNPGYQSWAQELVQPPGRIVALHADILRVPARVAPPTLPRARARTHLSSARKKLSETSGGGEGASPQADTPVAEGKDPFEDDSWIAPGKPTKP